MPTLYIVLEDQKKQLLYSPLQLLIPKDIKEFKVYTINIYKYNQNIKDKKIKYFTILIAKLN